MSLLKRDTSYCPSWREQVIKNEDGIMEKYEWITPVQGNKTKVICSLCSASRPFSVANGEITSCKQHACGMTHKKVVKERSQGKIQTRLFDGATGPGSCLSEADMLTRAETLRALHLVASNHSFASASEGGFLYRTMFPNDPIAKKYKTGETKIKYLIQFGIAPYTKSSLLKDGDGRPFVFKFDETTTSQVKKQYDGYGTFFFKTANKVTTIYAGSLFVGHCMAADLVDHFNEFMKELDLNTTTYCFGISMDGPNDGPNVNLNTTYCFGISMVLPAKCDLNTNYCFGISMDGPNVT